MIEDKAQMLAITVKKLFRRGADQNIRRILNKTHKVDVAALLDTFQVEDRVHIFNLLSDIDKKADVLSYLQDESQVEVIQRLSKNEVLQMVSLMESDDAADLLGNLSEEESKEILDSMKKQDSEDVADLMGYPEDSAGGLMNSDYLSFEENNKVSEVIQYIQDNEETQSFYVYVENEHNHLIGVVSLKQLLLSKKSETLKSIMTSDVVSVTVDRHKNEVAKVVERYDFLSLPIVDSSNTLVGIITVDDVLDVIREEAEENLLQMARAGIGGENTLAEHFKARFTWLFLSLIGGLFCFAIIYFIGTLKHPGFDLMPIWIVSAFLPILLSIGATAGNQSVAVSIGGLKSGSFKSNQMSTYLKRESILSVMFAVIFSVIVFALGFFLFANMELVLILALVLFFLILFSVILGAMTPILMDKLGQDPTIASVPLFTVVIELLSVITLFGFASRFL